MSWGLGVGGLGNEDHGQRGLRMVGVRVRGLGPVVGE